MRVLLFGRLRDGAEALHGAEIASDARTVQQVLQWIEVKYPELSSQLRRPGVRFAVDQCFAELDTEVSRDSEIALMAPLSGG